MLTGLPSPAAAGEGQGEGASSGDNAEQRPAGRDHPHPLPPAGEGIADLLPLFLLLPLSMFALAPLVRGPMFASADGLLHLYRLVEFDQALRSGIVYPRWASDLLAGYGYPIFIFYAPVLYYLADALHFLGFGFASALKAAVGLGMLASSLGMYVFGRELWGRWGGFVAAAAYVYPPYRLVNTYLDGELAQTLAWAWLPWLAWACWRYLRTGRVRYGALAAICYAGLVATHSVTSWLTTIFLALALAGLLLIGGARLPDELRLGGFLSLGAGLAAPYWLPALLEQTYVQLGRVRIASYDFHTNLVPLDRVMSATLAHQYGDYIGVNGPAQLGLAQTAIAVVGLALLLWTGRRRALLFGLLALIAWLLMLKPAAFFWEHLPFGQFLQFPDRLLLILAFCLAILAGGLGSLTRRLPLLPAAACCLAAVGLLVYASVAKLDLNYVALPASIGPIQAIEYEQVSGAFGTTAKGEFTPKWMSAPPLTSPLLPMEWAGQPTTISLGPDAQLDILQRQPEMLEATINSTRSGLVELPVAYYPGWSAVLDGAPVLVQPGNHGLVSVEVPAGQTRVDLRFGTSGDRRLADALGLASLLSLAGLAVTRRSGISVLVGARAGQVGYGIALAGGAGLLFAGLWLTPDKLQLSRWPVQRTELVSYAGWLQLMGADVVLAGDQVHVSAAFRTGAAQSARPIAATVRVMTRETVWASASGVLPAQGWITAVPRQLDLDVSLLAGMPSGVYQLEIEIEMDGGVVGQEWTKLSYGSPRVGKVTLGSLTLPSAVPGEPSGRMPSTRDFGPLQLLAWQPPSRAEQGQFVPIALWWRPLAAPPADWGVSLHIVDVQGQVWAGHDDQPRLGYNPTSLWSAGQLQHDVQMAVLPSGMPPGDYAVLGSWYDVASKTPVGPQNLPIGTITVVPASHPDERLLDIPHRLRQAFPDGLELLGYDLPTTRVMAGQPLPLRLFWHAAEQPQQDLSLIVSFNGHKQALPLPESSRWQAGQLIETRLAVRTQADWAGSGHLGVSVEGTPLLELPEILTLQAPPR